MDGGDLLLEILRIVAARGYARSSAACRLVSREWRRAADAVLTSASSDFLAAHPDAGRESRELAVRAEGARVVFVSPAGRPSGPRAAGAAGAAEAAAFGLLGPASPGGGGTRLKDPARLLLSRRLSLGDLAAVAGMSHTLQELDLNGWSGTLPRQFRTALCVFVGGSRRLSVLRARAQGLDGQDLRLLARNRSLRHLDLGRNRAGATGCAAVGAVTTLVSLDLSDNRLPWGVGRLAGLSGLRSLNLSLNPTADPDLAAALAGTTSLTALDAAWSSAGAATARAIAGLPLVRLDASFSDRSLCASPPAALARLTVNFVALSEGDLARVAACCPALRSLSASNSSVTPRGLRALAPLGHSLTELDVSWNSLPHQAAPCLLEGFPALRRLDVRRNELLDAGALALFGAPALVWLDLSHNGLSRTAVAWLRHRASGRRGFALRVA